MLARLERYTLEGLLVPAAQIRVLHQRLRRAQVHWHDFYELAYVLDGTARHTVNGTEHSLGPGSAFMLTPADFHELTSTSDRALTCYNVVIDPSALAGELGELLPLAARQVVWMADDLREVEPDFHRLWQESATERLGTRPMMSALLRCILVGLARRCFGAGPGDRAETRPGVDPGLRRAILFVDHNFRDPITLADAAAQAHLSPNYFSERFHEFTGVPFQVYLQQRRLRFARSLLQATDLGITEVCHAAGFNSLSHFGRAYRRKYGQSPSAFRGVGDSAGPEVRASVAHAAS
jgi:AraC-like DNA-binding protein